MTPTTIRLPEPLQREIDRLAAQESRNRSKQIVHMLRLALVAAGGTDPLADGEALARVRLPVSVPVAGMMLGRDTAEVDPATITALEPCGDGCTEIHFNNGREPVRVVLPPPTVKWMLHRHGLPADVRVSLAGGRGEW